MGKRSTTSHTPYEYDSSVNGGIPDDQLGLLEAGLQAQLGGKSLNLGGTIMVGTPGGRRNIDGAGQGHCCNLGKTDNVARAALVTVVALASLTISAWALWSRYNAAEEEIGAVQHENQLEEYSQELTGLKLCLEFGFLLEVSTSLLARTDEFLDAEAKAELDLEAMLRRKVSKGLLKMETGLIEGSALLLDKNGTSAIREVFRGANGVQDVVQSAVRGFQSHIAVLKRDTLQKTERVLWEQADVWNGVQQRLLQLEARLRTGAEGHPERERMVLATGTEGHGRAGLGRYTANFFSNLRAFEATYRGKRGLLSPERRGELERLRQGVIQPRNAVVSAGQIERMEKQLREVISATGLPPYVSTQFNHQLEACVYKPHI